MSENISANKILSNFRRSKGGRDPLLFLQRLDIQEKRKREQEETKRIAFDEFRKLSLTAAKAERRHKVAKIGGFEGNLFDFFKNPEVGEASFDLGIGMIAKDPSLLPPSSIEKGLSALKDVFSLSNLRGPFNFGAWK